MPNFENRELLPRIYFDTLVGESEAFLRTLEKIRLFAGTGATVLITGETGTGKELFARAIHYHGVRRGQPFIPVNCGALPDALIENELFGHSKGAYTDAASTEKGLVAEADRGTLFLDEIDALSCPAQAKLLRFLQRGEYRPVGCARSAHADVRVVVASNADLLALVQEKRFREDLFYRLHVLSVTIPPLRQRLGDIPLLVAHFAAHYGRTQGYGPVSVSEDALRKLLAHTWPGNIRELEGVLQRAVLHSGGATIEADHVELAGAMATEKASGTLSQAKMAAMQEFERTYLINLLRVHHGNVTHAAKAAGKERRTFQRLLTKHQLHRSRFA
jgi:DNA-binding NtrC family response regulator